MEGRPARPKPSLEKAKYPYLQGGNPELPDLAFVEEVDDAPKASPFRGKSQSIWAFQVESTRKGKEIGKMVFRIGGY